MSRKSKQERKEENKAEINNDTYRMGREDLKRISRALALFRPSFLALIMNLTEEDLVFMEKCMQRTLLVGWRCNARTIIS